MAMATPHPVARECRGPDCRTRRPRGDLRHGKYCSEACEHRRTGADALEDFKHSHTHCYTCGSRLKHVYRPTERGRGLANGRAYALGVYKAPPDDLQGWQSRTPNAAIGERVVADDPLRISTGTVCAVCGSTTPNDRIAELFEQDPEGYARRLLDASGVKVDREAFWDAFDGVDVEYAVGKSLIDDG